MVTVGRIPIYGLIRLNLFVELMMSHIDSLEDMMNDDEIIKTRVARECGCKTTHFVTSFPNPNPVTE